MIAMEKEGQLRLRMQEENMMRNYAVTPDKKNY